MDSVIRAIIVNPSEKFGQILSAGLSAEGISASICSEIQLAEIIANGRADAVIMENDGKETVIPEIISAFRETSGKAFFIVIGESDKTLDNLIKDIGCVIPHPVDAKIISRIIVSAYVKRSGFCRDELEKYAENMLCEAGMIPNLLGTGYLAYSVAMSVMSGMMSDIYSIHKAAAVKSGRTAASVERAVRTSLRISCDRGNTEFIRNFIHDENSASGSFIEYFSDMLRNRIIKNGNRRI